MNDEFIRQFRKTTTFNHFHFVTTRITFIIANNVILNELHQSWLNVFDIANLKWKVIESLFYYYYLNKINNINNLTSNRNFLQSHMDILIMIQFSLHKSHPILIWMQYFTIHILIYQKFNSRILGHLFILKHLLIVLSNLWTNNKNHCLWNLIYQMFLKMQTFFGVNEAHCHLYPLIFHL